MRLRRSVLSFALVAAAFVPALADVPEVVARIGDQQVTKAELMEAAAPQLQRLRSQEYDILRGTVDQLIVDRLITAAAAKENKAADVWFEEQLAKRVTPPTDAEIQALYDQYKPRLGGQTLEQAKQQLSSMATNQQKQKISNQIVEELRAKSQVVVLLEPPRLDVKIDDDPMYGPADAPVTIVEFSDYQCPFCSRAEQQSVKQVKDVYKDKVRVVFRDFPLSFHRNAQKAHEAAGCADEQGKFWALHDKLFENQNALEPDNLVKYAGEVGLDTAKFKECLDSGKRKAEVDKDAADGRAVGVSGTPAFFINGRFLNGAQPFENFAKLIDEELTRLGIAIPAKPAPGAPQAAAAAPSPAPTPVAAKPAAAPKAKADDRKPEKSEKAK